MKKQIVTFFGSTLLFVSCTTSSGIRSIPEGSIIPEVKVLIAENPLSVAISANEAFAVKSPENEDVTFVSAGQKIECRINENRVEAFDQAGKSLGAYANLKLTSKNKSHRFQIGSKSYRGEILIIVHDGKLLVVNQLDMDLYLFGVVRNEIGTITPEQVDAAKAQAVAARTYAIKNRGKYKLYDYRSDINDQVYEGAGSESELTTQAVIETLGEIVQLNDKPIDAVYFSTAGGVTAPAQSVWTSSKPSEYLTSVSTRFGNTYFDAASPYFRWEVMWKGEDLEKIVKTNLPDILKLLMPGEDFDKLANQKLYNVTILSRDSSQRIQKIKFGFTRDSYTVTGEQARRILRTEKGALYSALFKVDMIRNPDGTIQTMTAKGGGYGHGVGMCQYSAREMAKLGFSYKQILGYFYRGTVVKKIY